MEHISLSSTLINHFDITEHTHLNHGGQKTVFSVTIKGIKYALKLIHFVDERSEREIRISSEFAGGNGIPAIIKVEKVGDKTIILEEFIEGNDLAEVKSRYKGDEVAICQLMTDIASILKPVWIKRYIHRDLKPQNIRIKPDGKPVILDFGIARALDEESITATGSQPLSWLYASPEQYFAKKELISYRTDFFCLGIIAYELFTGSLPFGKDRMEIHKSFDSSTPIKEIIENTILTEFCGQVLKLSPSERPRTIESFINLLRI